MSWSSTRRERNATDRRKRTEKSIEKWLNPDPNADRMVDIDDITVSVMMEIEEQPTAYDVDKVVAELERLRNIERNRPDRCNVDGFGDPEDIYEDGVSQGRFEAYWEAVQIVKGGGVDGR